MAYNLFLDDVRQPREVVTYFKPVEHSRQYATEDWDVVKTYHQFVFHIMKYGLPTKVSFDHDLADIHYDPKTWTEGFKYHEKTGYDAAKWLCDYCYARGLKLPKWYVHSMNPVGSERIKTFLTKFERQGYEQ